MDPPHESSWLVGPKRKRETSVHFADCVSLLRLMKIAKLH